MSARIIRVYSDVSMSNGHAGLLHITGKKEIKEGELVVFVNRAKSAAKVMAPNDLLFHVRPRSGKLEMKAIIELPKAIGVNGELNYNKALEIALRKT